MRQSEKAKHPIALSELASELNINEDEVIAFIYACTLAQRNGKALIDARYHYFLRALEGAYIKPKSGKQIHLENKSKAHHEEQTYDAFEIAVCGNCGEYALVGKEITCDGSTHRLAPTSIFDEKRRYYHVIENSDSTIEVFDVDDNSEELLDDEDDEVKIIKAADESKAKFVDHLACKQCGAIGLAEDEDTGCDCDPDYLRVREYIGKIGACANCFGGKYYRYQLSGDIATSVLATSLFEELPTKIHKARLDYDEADWNGGKQFLAFSDSRSEAAFFAPYLEKMHREFLRRRGIVQVLTYKHDEILQNYYYVKHLVRDLAMLFDEDRSFVETLNPNDNAHKVDFRQPKMQAWVAIVNEIIKSKSGAGLAGLGFMQFQYFDNNNRIIKHLAEKYDADPSTIEGLINALIETITSFGALHLSREAELSTSNEDEWKYLFYTKQQKAVMCDGAEDMKPYHMRWMPRHRKGKIDQIYPNSRQRLVQKILKIDNNDAAEFLGTVFEWMKESHLLVKGTGNWYSLNIDNFRILLLEHAQAEWYRCERCGRVTTANLGHCAIMSCNGATHRITEQAHPFVDHVEFFGRNVKLLLDCSGSIAHFRQSS